MRFGRIQLRTVMVGPALFYTVYRLKKNIWCEAFCLFCTTFLETASLILIDMRLYILNASNSTQLQSFFHLHKIIHLNELERRKLYKRRQRMKENFIHSTQRPKIYSRHSLRHFDTKYQERERENNFVTFMWLCINRFFFGENWGKNA